MKPLIAVIKRPNILKIVLAFTVILVTIASLYLYTSKQDRVAVEDSVISAPLIAIAPPTAGKLTSIGVYENEKVKKGDVLMTVGDQTITADTDGLVVSANNIVGAMVSSQTPIIQMINPADMRVAGTIDENKGLNKLRVGQVIRFTVDAFPGKTYWGYIDEISPTAKQTQAAFSISSERPTQQFVVYARFDTAKHPEIKNGMSAKMTVYTKMP